MSAVSSSYDARTWNTLRNAGVRSDIAPVKGLKNGMPESLTSGSAASEVGVPT